MADPQLAALTDLALLTGLPQSDPRLELALRRASNRFRGQVNHPVHAVEGDEITLNGNGTDTLLLPAAPVNGTPTVLVDGVPVADFTIDRNSGVLRRNGCWPDGLGNIRVTYNHGWATIPGDIEDAILEQAQIVATTLPHLQQESAGTNSVTYGAQATIGVTQKWTDAVEKYCLGEGDRS